MDDAISAYAKQAGLKASAEQKMDEIPYDFVRKFLSVVTANSQGDRTLLTKGALENILKLCIRIQVGNESRPLDDRILMGIEQRYSEWSAKPRPWNTVFIRNYMAVFGLVSSILIS